MIPICWTILCPEIILPPYRTHQIWLSPILEVGISRMSKERLPLPISHLWLWCLLISGWLPSSRNCFPCSVSLTRYVRRSVEKEQGAVVQFGSLWGFCWCDQGLVCGWYCFPSFCIFVWWLYLFPYFKYELLSINWFSIIHNGWVSEFLELIHSVLFVCFSFQIKISHSMIFRRFISFDWNV